MYFLARVIGVFSQGLSLKPNNVSLDNLPEGNIIPGLSASKNTLILPRVVLLALCVSFSLFQTTGAITSSKAPSGTKRLSESLDVIGSLVTEPEAKAEAVGVIKNKYGVISQMFLRGPDEHRAIIKLDEVGGE